jgi:ABC-type multidrug transport system fused ATPase/permease subunit
MKNSALMNAFCDLRITLTNKKQNFLKRTVYLFRPFWSICILVSTILLLGQIIGTFAPYLFGKAIDAVIHVNERRVILFLGLSFSFAVIQQIGFAWAREYFELTKLDENTDQYFSSLALKKMLSFSVGQHVNEHSGIRQTIVTRGQNALNEYVNNMLYVLIPNFFQVGTTLVLLAWVEWRVALVALTFVCLFIWISQSRHKRFFDRIDVIQKKRRAHTKMQTEFFRNSTLVIAEAQEGRASREYDGDGEAYLSYSESVWLPYLHSFYMGRPIIVVGQYASLGVGVYLIFIGNLSAGMFVTLFSWASTIFGNLIQVMSVQRRMSAQKVEIKKMYDLLDIVPDIDPNTEGKKIEKLLGSIEFRDVGFAYPYRYAQSETVEDLENNTIKDTPVISGVSFKIPAGAKVGFVGLSGSGKSTIVNLMRRYYDPTEGEILVDGVPLKEIDLHWLRSQIGNVDQKIELFDRSIRKNILFGLPEDKIVSEEELVHVIQDASLDDFISKLKNGLETHIGENGIKVSGGERQRIGIARAFIKDPKILIFDEATSALDSINEKLIHEAINRGAKGRTTIIIAHRLSTIADADIIFVVADGKIVASGTNAELTENSLDYQQLIKNQILAS